VAPTLPEPCGPGDHGELAAYLPAVQRRAVLAAEHQIVVLPGVARTEPFGGLPLAVLPERFHDPLGQLEDASALAGLGVALGPHGPVHGHRARVEVDLGPGQCAGFLGADADQQRQNHVCREAVLAAHGGLPPERYPGTARHRLATVTPYRARAGAAILPAIQS